MKEKISKIGIERSAGKKNKNYSIMVGENYISTLVKEASNPWGMGKDGKKYHSASYLLALIKNIAKKCYKNQNKRELIERARKMFYRLVGK